MIRWSCSHTHSVIHDHGCMLCSKQVSCKKCFDGGIFPPYWNEMGLNKDNKIALCLIFCWQCNIANHQKSQKLPKTRPDFKAKIVSRFRAKGASVVSPTPIPLLEWYGTLQNKTKTVHVVFDILATVKYRGPPEITKAPENASRFQGEDHDFFCQPISTVGLHVQWVKHYTVDGSYFDYDGNAYLTTIKVESLITQHNTQKSLVSETDFHCRLIMLNRYNKDNVHPYIHSFICYS